MKNLMNQLQLGALPLVFAAALTAPAIADGRNPSSLLLFPQFRHSAATSSTTLPPINTVITITNTHPTQSAFVHIVMINAVTCNHADWPTQTIPQCGSYSILSSQLFPPITTGEEGYLYAYAVQSANPGVPAVSFNFLIGDCMVVDGINAPSAGIITNYSIDPVGFAAVNPVLNAPLGFSPPAFPQLDGIVYSKAPARILIPRFMGQDTAPDPIVNSSDLVLLSLAGTTTTTSTPSNIQTLVDLLVFNDNEEAFSAQYQFRCWKRDSLLNINGIFAERFLRDFTNDNPNEIRLTTAGTTKEAGWMFLEGNNAFSTSENISSPAIMAFLIENTTSGGVTKTGAELPFFIGERTGRIAP
ncbi:MAG: hypothetical protein HZA53_15845 [Planctomycetes bacterium]|nr:hypothetical protein [Planctomycetota bacterium]